MSAYLTNFRKHAKHDQKLHGNWAKGWKADKWQKNSYSKGPVDVHQVKGGDWWIRLRGKKVDSASDKETAISIGEKYVSRKLTKPSTTSSKPSKSVSEVRITDAIRKKYPVDTTGNVVVGDTIVFREGVFTGSHRNAKHKGDRIIEAKVVRDSYGKSKQQHTFSLKVIRSSGTDPVGKGKTIRRKGRNVYRNGTYRQRWSNEAARKEALEEKYSRGDAARAERAQRLGIQKHLVYKHDRKSSGDSLRVLDKLEVKASTVGKIRRYLEAIYERKSAEFQWHADGLNEVENLRDELNLSLSRLKKHAQHDQKTHGNWARGYKVKETYRQFPSYDDDFLPIKNPKLMDKEYKSYEKANQEPHIVKAIDMFTRRLSLKHSIDEGVANETAKEFKLDDDDVKDIRDTMDSLASPANQNFMSYRGINSIRASSLDEAYKGRKILINSGFTSTTIDSSFAKKWARDTYKSNAVMRIKVPKGTPIISINDIVNHARTRQGEVVLPRGAKLEVFRISKEEHTDEGFTKYYDVRLVEDYVEKHVQHNQKTHGNWARGIRSNKKELIQNIVDRSRELLEDGDFSEDIHRWAMLSSFDVWDKEELDELLSALEVLPESVLDSINMIQPESFDNAKDTPYGYTSEDDTGVIHLNVDYPVSQLKETLVHEAIHVAEHTDVLTRDAIEAFDSAYKSAKKDWEKVSNKIFRSYNYLALFDGFEKMDNPPVTPYSMVSASEFRAESLSHFLLKPKSDETRYVRDIVEKLGGVDKVFSGGMNKHAEHDQKSHGNWARGIRSNKKELIDAIIENSYDRKEPVPGELAYGGVVTNFDRLDRGKVEEALSYLPEFILKEIKGIQVEDMKEGVYGYTNVVKGDAGNGYIHVSPKAEDLVHVIVHEAIHVAVDSSGLMTKEAEDSFTNEFIGMKDAHINEMWDIGKSPFQSGFSIEQNREAFLSMPSPPVSLYALKDKREFIAESLTSYLIDPDGDNVEYVRHIMDVLAVDEFDELFNDNVKKHAQHDQKSHGNWARGNKKRIKDILDRSAARTEPVPGGLHKKAKATWEQGNFEKVDRAVLEEALSYIPDAILDQMAGIQLEHLDKFKSDVRGYIMPYQGASNYIHVRYNDVSNEDLIHTIVHESIHIAEFNYLFTRDSMRAFTEEFFKMMEDWADKSDKDWKESDWHEKEAAVEKMDNPPVSTYSLEEGGSEFIAESLAYYLIDPDSEKVKYVRDVVEKLGGVDALFEELKKHAQHNQKTHGNWARGLGGTKRKVIEDIFDRSREIMVNPGRHFITKVRHPSSKLSDDFTIWDSEELSELKDALSLLPEFVLEKIRMIQPETFNNAKNAPYGYTSLDSGDGVIHLNVDYPLSQLKKTLVHEAIHVAEVEGLLTTDFIDAFSDSYWSMRKEWSKSMDGEMFQPTNVSRIAVGIERMSNPPVSSYSMVSPREFRAESLAEYFLDPKSSEVAYVRDIVEEQGGLEAMFRPKEKKP